MPIRIEFNEDARDFAKSAGVEKGKTGRKIMRALKINEISAVDVPAQQGAVAVIMKRKGEPGYDPKNPDPKKRGRHDPEAVAKGLAVTDVVDGHQHLIFLREADGTERMSGHTSWDDEHSHSWIRREDGSILILMENGHVHDVSEIANADDLDKAAAAHDVGMEDDQMTDKTKKGEEPTVEQLKAQLERSERIASLSDAHKAHLKTLDGEAASEFLAKSEEDREADVSKAVNKAQEKDPVAYTTAEGVELRKSAGEAVIALAKSNDELRKRLDEERAKTARAELVKRAEEELKHIPGTVEARADMLKAIESIEDEGSREAALNALKAQNEAMATAFETNGHLASKAQPGSPAEALDNMAKALQEKDSDLSYEQAYTKAVETPEGRALYAKSCN